MASKSSMWSKAARNDPKQFESPILPLGGRVKYERPCASDFDGAGYPVGRGIGGGDGGSGMIANLAEGKFGHTPYPNWPVGTKPNVPPPSSPHEQPWRKPRRVPDMQSFEDSVAGQKSGRINLGKRTYPMDPAYRSRLVIGPNDEYEVQAMAMKESMYEDMQPGAAGNGGGAFTREAKDVQIYDPKARTVYKQNLGSTAHRVDRHRGQDHTEDVYFHADDDHDISPPAGLGINKATTNRSKKEKFDDILQAKKAAGSRSGWDDEKVRCTRFMPQRPRADTIGQVVFNIGFDMQSPHLDDIFKAIHGNAAGAEAFDNY